GKRRVDSLGEQWEGAFTLNPLAGGQAQGHHRSPVEGPSVSEEERPSSEVSCQFHCGLVRFGTTVPEVDHLLEVAGNSLDDLLCELYEVLVVEVRVGEVQKLPELPLGGLDYLLVSGTRGDDRDSRREVEELVSVDVPNYRTVRGIDNQRILS